MVRDIIDTKQDQIDCKAGTMAEGQNLMANISTSRASLLQGQYNVQKSNATLQWYEEHEEYIIALASTMPHWKNKNKNIPFGKNIPLHWPIQCHIVLALNKTSSAS